ncbi:hypothetical protein H0A73_17360 [Alcaligenaceae bacterium]|nr:hypothetical protein [Alcaligenaceae bacterium]
MIDSDRAHFFGLVADVYAFYGREFSDFAGTVWWAAMRSFDLVAVNDAFGRHCVNPDAGQYLPKPADIVRMLQGSTQDAAMVAWSKVDRAVRSVGAYQTVAFDDPIIHRALEDMGGWITLGQKSEKEWPFVAKEFENRYRGYRSRSEVPAYPSSLPGIAQAQNAMNGHGQPEPVLIGNAEVARRVLLGGSDKPAISFARPAALQLEIA